jgi:AAA+ ATPase superfamily predicted ATPase
VFQLCWDEILRDSNIMLILCGSSVSMMIKGALSRESPLYGRRSGQWKLMPLGFRHVMRFFPKKSLEEAIGFYSVTGGIPEYILKMDQDLGLHENIVKKVLSKGEVLYQEADFLLQEELRDPSTYKSILWAMARSAKVTDIANKAGIPATDMPKYLNVLQKIELVERELPVTETRSKKSSYRIKDNFFCFWFRVAFPYLSELEEGKGKEILKKQESTLKRHIANTFEKVCHEAVVISRGLEYNKIGRWWGAYREEGERKVQEIDIVGLDEKSRSMLFGECKFEHKVDAHAVLDQLRGKAELVEWNRKEERFVIFAKSFSKRIDEEDVELYNLGDLERIFKKAK